MLLKLLQEIKLQFQNLTANIQKKEKYLDEKNAGIYLITKINKIYNTQTNFGVRRFFKGGNLLNLNPSNNDRAIIDNNIFDLLFYEYE